MVQQKKKEVRIHEIGDPDDSDGPITGYVAGHGYPSDTLNFFSLYLKVGRAR